VIGSLSIDDPLERSELFPCDNSFFYRRVIPKPPILSISRLSRRLKLVLFPFPGKSFPSCPTGIFLGSARTLLFFVSTMATFSLLLCTVEVAPSFHDALLLGAGPHPLSRGVLPRRLVSPGGNPRENTISPCRGFFSRPFSPLSSGPALPLHLFLP